jgi:hypothetical protein
VAIMWPIEIQGLHAMCIVMHGSRKCYIDGECTSYKHCHLGKFRNLNFTAVRNWTIL